MSKKFVIALNKSADPVRLMNAIAHCSIGLGGALGNPEEMGLIPYIDADGNEYPNISRNPYIVLKTSGGKLKTFRESLLEENVPYTTFTDTMIEGGWEQQIADTKSKPQDDITFWAVAAFGDRAILDPLTKKFSLYR